MKLEFKNCDEEYWEFVRILRNDDRVQSGFIQNATITPSEQQEYMAIWHKNYYVALADGEPAGYCGAIKDDIRIAVHPDYQGKGIGTFLIENLVERYPTAFAKVKIDNEASLKLFERCGFTKKYFILEQPDN